MQKNIKEEVMIDRYREVGERELEECKGRLEVAFGRFEIENSQTTNAGRGWGWCSGE